MKRLNKKSVILAALGLLIGSGAYLNYQMSKTDTAGMSDLTLANLEAMAWDLDDPDNPDKWEGIEMTVDCNNFCYRDPNKACLVPIQVNNATLNYTCDSWRK